MRHKGGLHSVWYDTEIGRTPKKVMVPLQRTWDIPVKPDLPLASGRSHVISRSWVLLSCTQDAAGSY